MIAKKIFPFILFLCFASVILYLLTSELESGVDPVSLLPQDTLALVDLKNPAKSYVRFTKSRLGRQIGSISREEVFRDVGFTGEQIAYLTTRFEEIRSIVESPLFKEIFGRRALWALLPDTGPVQYNAVRSDIRDRFLLICHPQHRASLLQFFSSFFSGQFEYTSFSYKGKAIRRYTFSNDLTVYSTVTDGLVIIAFSQKPLRESLDRSFEKMTSGRSGLELNSEYRELKNRTGDRDDQFVFADLESVLGEFNPYTGSRPHLTLKNIHTGGLPAQAPFKSFAFFRQPGNATVKYTGILRVSHKGFPHGCDDLVLAAPVINSEIQQVPGDLIFYFWTNLFNLKEIWNSISQSGTPAQVAYLNSIEQWILANTGFSKVQFLRFFGDQISLNISEIRNSGFLPMPRLCLQVELADSEQVKGVIETLLAGQPVRHSRIGGHDVYSVMLAGGLMQPSYAIVDSFLVFADSPDQIRYFIEERHESLASNPLLRKVDVNLTGPNNFVLYLKGDELLDGVKELAAWAGTLLSVNGYHSGTMGKAMIDRVIIPILDGMKMYEVNAIRGYTNETELIFESALLKKKD